MGLRLIILASAVGLGISFVRSAPGEELPGGGVYFQAHRGAVDEAPENTMAAFRHAWGVRGAVPEADIRTTRDGVMVCLHDATPGRTTTAPDDFKEKDVSGIAFEQLRQWDAGAKFDPKFAGEKVPALRELLEEIKGRPGQELYLDLKGVDLAALEALLEEYGVTKQVIFVQGSQEACVEVLQRFPGARTMTWISGFPLHIKRRFEALAKTDFEGISQLQFHLRARRTEPEITYVLGPEFLQDAQEKLRAAGVEFQLRPFAFDGPSLRRLLDLGVRWFVTDAPARFAAALREAQQLDP